MTRRLPFWKPSRTLPDREDSPIPYSACVRLLEFLPLDFEPRTAGKAD